MDLAEIDENGKGLQFFGKTKVERLEKIEGQPNVYLLQTTIELERPNQAVPKPGQFYLIRSAKSAVHYNRPTFRNARNCSGCTSQYSSYR
ncbi:MAG: hypothetical protein J6Y60_00510 [Treponema sp.]|nr:hypothetical protein [Treponema sp.]